MTRETRFTLLEHAEVKRGLQVRPITSDEERLVKRAGGYVFETAAEAEEFAARDVWFEDGPPIARQAFSHKKIGGHRIYMRVGTSI